MKTADQSSETEIVIAGAAESSLIGKVPSQSTLDLHADAAFNLFGSSKHLLKKIDGIASSILPPTVIADYLGMSVRWVDGTNIGGSSVVSQIANASAAIRDELCNAVLIVFGQSGRSRIGIPPRPSETRWPASEYEELFGAKNPLTQLTLTATAFMNKYEIDEEELAAVPVAQRKWSHNVSRAKMRDLLTVEQVLDSPYVMFPLHLFECCLVTDAGAAVLITSRSYASEIEIGNELVDISGTGLAVGPPNISSIGNPAESGVFKEAGERAFESSGRTTEDVDHLMLYDAFAHLPLMALQELEFVSEGDAGRFVLEGNTSPGGILPMNTNGGGLSYTHPGQYGMFEVTEAYRQLTNTAENQVPKVRCSMLVANGHSFNSAGALILEANR